MANTANSASAANQVATANGPTAANSVTILEQGRVGGIGDIGRGAGKPAAGGGGGGVEVTRQDDIIHWWKGEDLTDSVGSADLIANNSAGTAAGVGVNGETVLATDGVDQWWHTDDLDIALTDAFSVSMWVQSREASTTVYTGAYQSFLTWGGDTLVLYGHWLGPHPSNAGWMYAQAHLDDDPDSGTYIREQHFDDQAPIIDCTDWVLWTHTWASGNTPKLYSNADLSETGTAVSGTLDNVTIGENAHFYINHMHVTSSGYAFSGYYQQIRVYDVELSASDVSDIYNSGAGDWS